jgi:hypothetical protein|nr:MAG TPA: hypothetical protein [Caudoviricetes sp.]
MLIVSQNKNVITNFQRINFIRIEPNKDKFDIEISYGEEYWDVLGTYDSYEKCKEILNAITQEFKRIVLKVNRQNTMQSEFYNIPKVYYMPEK